MSQVFRCYVEKRPGFDVEAAKTLRELRDQLGIAGLTGLRLFNRYDVEGVDEAVYQAAKPTVFSEPQCDHIYDERLPQLPEGTTLLAVEALPGQYDQRADSCAQCMMLLAGVAKPAVANARVYAMTGSLSQGDLDRIRGYLINPVECRQASMEKPHTLARGYDTPDHVAVLAGFTALDETGLEKMLGDYGLAMDLADLKFLQSYFRDEEGRDPTITEVRVVDTYWSDHCRHTTFSTHINSVEIMDQKVAESYRRYLDARVEVYGKEKASVRPQTLMDIATIGAKTLKKRGLLKNLDESEEINACSIRVKAVVDGQEEDWLLLFKNETHNHPTEIEPFGGAATCIGGCIRDPLSGRAYVYQAMRLTGCGDPRAPMGQTLEGKLPQRKLAQTAAAGYSSYGNQIGLATGLVDEVYHEGYVAKHLEVGAVVGAAPEANVVRERPVPGDVVILLGGRTGRDGIGGATGSSKSHNQASLTTMASEVQKGNAPEERKIQRLFRDPAVTRLIKRCNDFGAGGVSVAIGELADGLSIDLDAVRKKYDGLDGTELAISESQERMAVVVAAQDEAVFLAAAQRENLEAYRVAVVTENPRMVMTWKGQTIADLSRAFLNTNGAVKRASVFVPARKSGVPAPFADLRSVAGSLKCGSRRGLAERFDGSVGAASVLMPYGGATQRTPTQVMAATLPVEPGKVTETCSVMSWGFDPDWMSADPYGGAGASVVLSMAKLVAAGCDPQAAYLTFQEYFEKLREEPERWGKPFQALLGALDAQLGLGAAAIGGKDSMSGSFLDLDVPPTLISFAVAPALASQVLSPEFKAPDHPVYLFPVRRTDDYEGMKKAWACLHNLAQAGKVAAAWAVEAGGVAEGAMKMALGNHIGFLADAGVQAPWYGHMPGAIMAELTQEVYDCAAVRIGMTTKEPVVAIGEDSAGVDELRSLWEGVLEEVYATDLGTQPTPVEPISYDRRSPAVFCGEIARPRAVIPVFPGTNCEYDTASSCRKAGIEPEILVIRNLSPKDLEESADALDAAISRSQMIVLPGGFSGGDEPDGSAKFIVSFFRNPKLMDGVHDLLKNRDGLMLGICNGFQALVKLGLVPYGEIRPATPDSPTLTFNLIGRHQSRYVTTRVASVRSPWMLLSHVGDVHAIVISHGEGRFVAPQAVVDGLIASGQVATQYVNPATGLPDMGIDCNPNGSVSCIEGIFSPDGRVFGKMGHTERSGVYIAKNIPGDKLQPLFESGALYFR